MWTKTSEECVQRLVESTPQRTKAVLTATGDRTRYYVSDKVILEHLSSNTARITAQLEFIKIDIMNIDLCPCVFLGSRYTLLFPLTCNFTVTGGCLRERAPRGAACCMVISVSAGGKDEQKSLRDREGPHRSPGPFLGRFWTAVTHYSPLRASRSSFIQAAAPW